MKIGILGSSFNPPHEGHLKISKEAIDIFALDQIWWLITKKNPYQGDNNHLHHYLVKKFNHNLALIIYFLLVNVPIVFSLYTSINKLLIIFITILIYFIFLISYKIKLKQ